MASNNSSVGRKCPPHRSQQLYLPPGSPPNILRNHHFNVFQGCFASPHASEATKFQWIKFLDPSPMGFGPGNEEAQRKAIAPVPLQ